MANAIARKFFASGQTRDLKFRISQLNAVKKLMTENQKEIVAAVHADLRKPELEAVLGEISQVVNAVDFTLKHLYDWTSPQKVGSPVVTQPATSFIVPEPLGVALIISPWNFPVLLLLEPLIGAISAGNCSVLKPSEISANTAAILAKLIPKYLHPEFVQVVLGGPQETSALLDEHWDKIFYTGNTRVGSIILEKAAKHLTPVTLELGGKSPVIVDRSANLDVTARRIINTKFFNSGQICVAPDYLLVHQAVHDELVKKLQQNIETFYGKNPQESQSLGRMINKNHHQRVIKLLKSAGGKVVCGGTWDEKDLYIAPTIITQPDPKSDILQEEIFGPLLPILTIPDIKTGIAYINQRPKPLALYVFASDSRVQDEVVAKTSSGSVCFNDCVYHITNPYLPFGGVGPSGHGAYHGKASFDTFSHYKAVMNKRTWLDPSVRYPPYSASSLKQLQMLMSVDLSLTWPKAIAVAAAGAGTAAYVLRSQL